MIHWYFYEALKVVLIISSQLLFAELNAGIAGACKIIGYHDYFTCIQLFQYHGD
jgi:predicted membrane-bound dolichyl-phosphate-mannose-protein mannosyltransferase